MTYSCNSLLQWRVQDKIWLERVLWIDPNGKNVLCLRIDPNNSDLSSWPFSRTKEALDAAVATDQARVLEKDPFLRLPVDPNGLSKQQKARWERNWKAIEDIVADPRKTMDHRNKWEEIAEHARKNGVNRRTIYRLLWKYWKGGQTPHCVLPGYSECGGKTPKFKGGKKPSRRSAREAEGNSMVGRLIPRNMAEPGEIEGRKPDPVGPVGLRETTCP